MSNIITLLPRHYIGTAAEIGGITGVCGDTARSTDTDVYYHWEGAAWLAGGIPYFVERLTGADDFTKVDFTCDGNPHVDGLDLSGILSPGAFVVKLRTLVADDMAGSFINIYRDAVNVNNKLQTKVFVAGSSVLRVEDVSIDTDLKLDYSASNVVFDNIDVTVLGWWMRRCL